MSKFCIDFEDRKYPFVIRVTDRGSLSKRRHTQRLLAKLNRLARRTALRRKLRTQRVIGHLFPTKPYDEVELRNTVYTPLPAETEVADIFAWMKKVGLT